MISINHQELAQEHFPDGTLHLKTPVIYPDSTIHIAWNYENDAELFTIICLARKYASQTKVLIMPYLPHARMDRIKNYDTEVFTLKYFCDTINDLKFDRVIILDAHSNVGPALLNNCENKDIRNEMKYAISDIIQRNNSEDNVVLFFPDEGSMKRYSEFSPLPYGFGIKQRDWETGRIKGLKIQSDIDLRGKDVLIVDDICSYGGTFAHAAKALREAGVNKIYLYVTHCEENILKGAIFNDPECKIEGIYTTTSLPALFKQANNMDLVPWIRFV